MKIFKYRLMEEEPGAGGGEGDIPPAAAAPDWRESIPAEYKDSAMFGEDQVKDLPSLITQFANSQQLLGDSIRIPGENADEDALNRFNEKLSGVKGVTRIPGMDASDEEKKAFYTKMGVPEDHNAYELYKPTDEDMPDGMELNGDRTEDFTKLAHEINLTPHQVKKLSEYYTTNSINDMKGKLESKNAMLDELKKEYGNDYESRVSLATSVIDKFGTKYALEDLAGDIGNHAGLAMMLADIGLATTEDGMMRLGADGGELTKSMTEVQMEIDELMADPGFADSKAENHNIIVKKLEKLYEQQELIKKQTKT